MDTGSADSPRRGPGRPRKRAVSDADRFDGIDSIPVIDPAGIVGAGGTGATGATGGTGGTGGTGAGRSTDGGQSAGRSRPRAAQAASSAVLKAEAYVPRILLVHGILSRWAPEFAITEADALELSKAYVGWRRYYGGVVDPKTEALMTLLMTAAIIYGPRLMRVSARMQSERAAARAQAAAERAAQGSTVVPMASFHGG
jgi:hypothetical protein